MEEIKNHAQPTTVLEICCFSISAVERVVASGIEARIELCAEQTLGGITPLEAITPVRDPPTAQSPTTIEFLKAVNSSHGVRVMIRPRGGDFNYTDGEFEAMRCAMSMVMSHSGTGAVGIAEAFVFGILTEDKKIDMSRCSQLVEHARRDGVRCTFHRAFDDVEDKEAALEQLIECGFVAVLTSGGPGDALQNLGTLIELVAQARGRIEIVVGGGVRANILSRLRVTGASAYHSSAVVHEGSELPSWMQLKQLQDSKQRLPLT